MYKVVYNSNPNKPIEVNHKGSLLFLVDVSERTFDTQYEALRFRTQCDSPITTIGEIVPNCPIEVLQMIELEEFEDQLFNE